MGPDRRLDDFEQLLLHISSDLEANHFASLLRRALFSTAKIIDLTKSRDAIRVDVASQLNVDPIQAISLLESAVQVRTQELISTRRKRVVSASAETDIDALMFEFLILGVKLDLLGIRPESGLISNFSLNIQMAPFLLASKGNSTTIMDECNKMVVRYSNIFHNPLMFLALNSNGYVSLSTDNLRAPKMIECVSAARDDIMYCFVKQLHTLIRSISDVTIDLDCFSTSSSSIKGLRAKQKREINQLCSAVRRWSLWKEYDVRSGRIASGWELRADERVLACSSGSGNKYPWADGDIELDVLPSGNRAKIPTAIADQYKDITAELARSYEDVGRRESETAGSPLPLIGCLPSKLARALTRFDAEQVELLARVSATSSEVASILNSQQITHAKAMRARELSALNFILQKRLTVVTLLIAQGAEVVKKWPACNGRPFDRVHWSRIAGVYELDAEILFAKTEIELRPLDPPPPPSAPVSDDASAAPPDASYAPNAMNSPLRLGNAAFEAGEYMLEQYMRSEEPELDSETDDSESDTSSDEED